MAWTLGDYLLVEGFGYEGVDGKYYYFIDSITGDEYFIKDASFYIQHHPIYLPWRKAPRFYIKRIFQIKGSIPITKPLYVSFENSVTSGWESLQDEEAGDSNISGEVFDGQFVREEDVSFFAVFENYKFWRAEQ